MTNNHITSLSPEPMIACKDNVDHSDMTLTSDIDSHRNMAHNSVTNPTSDPMTTSNDIADDPNPVFTSDTSIHSNMQSDDPHLNITSTPTAASNVLEPDDGHHMTSSLAQPATASSAPPKKKRRLEMLVPKAEAPLDDPEDTKDDLWHSGMGPAVAGRIPIQSPSGRRTHKHGYQNLPAVPLKEKAVTRAKAALPASKKEIPECLEDLSGGDLVVWQLRDQINPATDAKWTIKDLLARYDEAEGNTKPTLPKTFSSRLSRIESNLQKVPVSLVSYLFAASTRSGD